MNVPKIPIGEYINCIKCGELHISFPSCFTRCWNCDLYFCPLCDRWLSFNEFRGDFKEKGRKCASCRIRKGKYGRVGGLPVNLRFSILLRDNFRCVYCGRSAQETTLQIDHKVPFSKGGTDDSSNLVTACSQCNLGKSNQIIPPSNFPCTKNNL